MSKIGLFQWEDGSSSDRRETTRCYAEKSVDGGYSASVLVC